MSGRSDDDEEEQGDWDPEDPAPARPWGKVFTPKELTGALMVMAEIDGSQADELAGAVIATAAAKLQPTRPKGTKRRVHIQMASGVRFDIVVVAPAQVKKRFGMRGANSLPAGTTFTFARPNSKIKPSDGARIRTVRKSSSKGSAAVPEFAIKVEPVRPLPRVLGSRLRLHS